MLRFSFNFALELFHSVMRINWIMDKAHTQVQFQVKHMAISTIRGEFAEVDVRAETEALNFDHAKFQFSAAVESIHTGNKDRDNHLKSDDFFAALDFPEMKFSGECTGENKVRGNLTIKGVTRPIELDMDFGGIITEAEGKHRAGMEFTGELNRNDFNLNWSALTEAGSLVVSDTVKLLISLELLEAGAQL